MGQTSNFRNPVEPWNSKIVQVFVSPSSSLILSLSFSLRISEYWKREKATSEEESSHERRLCVVGITCRERKSVKQYLIKQGKANAKLPNSLTLLFSIPQHQHRHCRVFSPQESPEFDLPSNFIVKKKGGKSRINGGLSSFELNLEEDLLCTVKISSALRLLLEVCFWIFGRLCFYLLNRHFRPTAFFVAWILLVLFSSRE